MAPVRVALGLLGAAVVLSGCYRVPELELVKTTKNWTDEDKVGTVPDFYERVPKNILMISVDTFRRDHVGVLSGSDGPSLTPNLDTLANTGFVLREHTQCSNWTFAGVTCTMRGEYNVANGFIPRLAEATRERLPDGTGFLASWLGDAGYTSVLHSGNSWFGPTWNNAQGFTEVVKGNKSSATVLFEDAAEVMKSRILQGDEPWYLHVHLMEPHAPYRPPAEYLNGIELLDPIPWDLTDKDDHYSAIGQFNVMDPETAANFEAHLRLRYEGEIQWWDKQLGDILIEAGMQGLLEDTLVVIWNDHGEQFYEHGYQTHAYTLYREENDAWAIFWSQNIVADTWDEPTVSIDLVPTLLALQGIDLPPEVGGKPLGTRDPLGPRFATSVARLGAVQAVRVENFKMNYNWSGAVRVFDIASDPGEQFNIYDPNDEVSQMLWSHLGPWVEQTEPIVGEYSPNLPPGL